MGDNSDHALLSASGAERWGSCPASLRLTAAIPRTSSKYADEGTAAHAVAAWCLENSAMPDAYPDPAVDVDGTQWPVTQEMKNAVADYLKEVRSYVGPTSTLLAEQRVDYSDWIDVGDSFGTSDAVVLDAATPEGSDVEIKPDTLVIADLKYGQGVPVYAYELDENGKPQVNPQLALYALGCLYEYGNVANIRYVRMIIVQPRIDHVSICDVDVTDLKTFALKMKVAARRAMDVYESTEAPKPEHYKPSEKACRWCAAKHSCPALRSEVETETRDFFGHMVFSEDAPAELPQVVMAEVEDDTLSRVMSKLPLLEDFLKSIRAEVERRLLAGHPVPGFKLIEGRRGPRSWIDEAKAEKDLRRVLGAKDAIVIKPISPTAAEKFKKQGLLSERVWQNLNKNVDRSDGKPSVAPVSDPAPAISVVSVEEKFAQLTETADDLV